MKSVLLALLLTVGVLIVGGVVFVWSGLYNVAADVPHWEVTFWLMDQARERSVSFHSGGINSPRLTNPKLVDMGLVHFHETCRLCHGAPGYSRDEFAKGLYPSPPPLTSDETQKELNDAELFWIVKNGLKMTGMPSFGITHREEELWGIIAFLRRLPSLGPQEYGAMLKAAGLGREEGEEP